MKKEGRTSSSVDRGTIQSRAKARRKPEVATRIFESVGSSSLGLSRLPSSLLTPSLSTSNSPTLSSGSNTSSPLSSGSLPGSPDEKMDSLDLSGIPFDIAEYPEKTINNIIDFLREFQSSTKSPSKEDANHLVGMINSLITEFRGFIKPAQGLRSRCSSRSSSPLPLSELSTSSTKLGDGELRSIVSCLLSTKEFLERDYKVLCKNNLTVYFQTLLDIGQIDGANPDKVEDDSINKLTELSNSLSAQSSSSSDMSHNSVKVGALTVENSGIIDEPGAPGANELGWRGIDVPGSPGANELGRRGVERSESPGVVVSQSPGVQELTFVIEKNLIVEGLKSKIVTLNDKCNEYVGQIRTLQFELERAIKDKEEAEKFKEKKLCDNSLIEEVVNKKQNEIKEKIKEGYIKDLISLKEQLEVIQHDLSLASSGIIEYQELFATLMQATEELTKEHKIVNQRLMEALAAQAAAEESKKELEVAKAAALAAQAEAEGRAGVAEQEREAAEKRATAAEEAQEKSEAERDQAREAQKQALAELAAALAEAKAAAEGELKRVKEELADKEAEKTALQQKLEAEEGRARTAQAAAVADQQQVKAELEEQKITFQQQLATAQQEAEEAKAEVVAAQKKLQQQLEAAEADQKAVVAVQAAAVADQQQVKAELEEQKITFQQQLATAQQEAEEANAVAEAAQKKLQQQLAKVEAVLAAKGIELQQVVAELARVQLEVGKQAREAEGRARAAEKRAEAVEQQAKAEVAAAQKEVAVKEAELEKAMLELDDIKLFLAAKDKLLQENLNAATAAEKAMQEAEEEIKVCYDKLDSDIKMFETLLYNKEGVEKIISELEVKLHEFKDESININKKLSGDIKIEEERLLILQLELEKLNIQISTAKEELEATQKEAQEAKARVAELAVNNTKLQEVQEQLEAAQQQAEADLQQVKSELETAKEELDATQKEAQEAKARVAELAEAKARVAAEAIITQAEGRAGVAEQERDAADEAQQQLQQKFEKAIVERDQVKAELEVARAAEAAAEEQAMTQLAEVEKMRAELEATRTQAEIAKAKAAAVVEAKKAAEVRANAAQAVAEVARKKDLASKEDQTKAVSRVDNGRSLFSNNHGLTYRSDYNNPRKVSFASRSDTSSGDNYWKNYVVREIAENNAAMKDSKLIKNTVVPAAAIGSVGVFIAAAATNFLPFMLSIAAILLAIATFIFKDCKDEIASRKDNIKELSNQKVGFANSHLSKDRSGDYLRLQ